MLSGIFSPLELNVGIIAMCMPAFRRFVARFLPTCFGSTFASSGKYTPNAKWTPNTIGSSGKGSKGRRAKQDTLGSSLFQTDIMKTVDTRVEEQTEDQVRLVELGREGGGTSGALSHGEDRSQCNSECLYKAQHEQTLPKDW
jgi:hypothetical protein